MNPWHWVSVLLLLALCGLVVLIFLPSILELNNPKDKGPRKIPETTAQNETEKDVKSEE